MASTLLMEATTNPLRATAAGRNRNRNIEGRAARVRADLDEDPYTFGSQPRPDEGHVLRTVAHELRSPLTALVTSAEILQEDFDSLGPAQKREIVSSMHRGALWLHALVENLLCDATIREGRFQMHRQLVALAEVVAEVAPVVTPLLGRRRQTLRISTGHAVPEVLADPRRIGQVLVNLISNASKYGREGTPIEVSINAAGGWVRVAIADHGPGVPVADADLLFEPFYRSKAAHRSVLPGAGLGLSIVKFVIEAHGGHVAAFNRSQGGACFCFELPAARPSRLGSEAPEGGRP